MDSYLELSEVVRRANLKFATAGRILDRRYEECDVNGHIKANEELDLCEHCDRRLEYTTPKVDAILKERSNLPFYQHPLDAPFLEDERNREISRQKFEDLMSGLEKVINELGL